MVWKHNTVAGTDGKARCGWASADPLYQQYHDKGFNIISVSLDEKAEPWKAAIAKDNMPWYNASSLKGWNDPAALLYGVSAIPDNFLVDANGKIIARGLRGAALEERLKAILGPVK